MALTEPRGVSNNIFSILTHVVKAILLAEKRKERKLNSADII